MASTYINHFGSYLLEQNLSFNTIQSYDYSVKQFYKLSILPLPLLLRYVFSIKHFWTGLSARRIMSI